RAVRRVVALGEGPIARHRVAPVPQGRQRTPVSGCFTLGAALGFLGAALVEGLATDVHQCLLLSCNVFDGCDVVAGTRAIRPGRRRYRAGPTAASHRSSGARTTGRRTRSARARPHGTTSARSAR